MNGTIVGNNIQLIWRDIAQPIQIQSISLSLTPTQVQSNRFNVVSGATTLAAEFALRDYLDPKPIVDATVRASNAQLQAILYIEKAYGVNSIDKMKGERTMNRYFHAVD